MRLVDEHAATLHTSRVHAHAERIVAQAFVDAADAKQAGSEIFLCVHVDDADVCENFLPSSTDENFFKIFNNFFKEGSRSVHMRTHPRDPYPEYTTYTKSTKCVVSHDCADCDVCTGDTRNVRIEPSSTKLLAVSTRTVSVQSTVGESSAHESSPDMSTLPDDCKTCTRCCGVLPLASFTRNRARPDGYASACRECELTRKRDARANARTPSQIG